MILAWFAGCKGGASKAAKLLESSEKKKDLLLVFESKRRCKEAIEPREQKNTEEDSSEKNAK
jgi:hypothetical protein